MSPYVRVNIDSGSSSSQVRRQAIIWTSVELLTVGNVGTNLKLESNYKKFRSKQIWKCPLQIAFILS